MKVLLAALLAAASAVAQSVIDYSKLPQCAHQCAILQQAEGSCVPPAAPVTNQAIYQSCVCQSALLTTLKTSGQLCSTANPVCSADDANKISQYYVALCNGPVVQPQPSSTLTTTTSATTSAATGTGTAAAAGAGAKGVNGTSPGQKGWFSSHWKWVVMVIIIFLAIVILWVGGIFLRRHFDRKKEAQRANLAATNAPYNPPTPSSKSAASTSVTSPPMTMSGGRGGMSMDAGVGGIAPPRGTPRTRGRSDTLSSLRLSNGSKSNLGGPSSQGPVVWGPHQHLANNNGTYSPGTSVPPSPTSAMTPPNPMFRNRDASSSEPRFAHYRTTPTSMTPEETVYANGRASPGYSAWPASATGGDSSIRPHTTGREEGVVGQVASHTLSSVKSDPAHNPNLQGQSAEILQASPKKLHKRAEQ